MKLLVLSDLHVEFSAFTPSPVAVSTADAVVLAGDIHIGVKAVEWARKTFVDKPVILVAGNHELYHGDWERTLDEMRESALRHEVHFLENDAVDLNGIQFLGTTFWTDFCLFGEDRVTQAMGEARRFMMDYKLIHGCTPERTLERHVVGRAWLEKVLVRCEHPANCVVVTHHYPHRNSTATEYQSDLCSAAFGSQMPQSLFDQTALWIHGHTHTSFSYEVGDCRVLCNPRGYPVSFMADVYENWQFNPGLLIEQGSDGRWSTIGL